MTWVLRTALTMEQLEAHLPALEAAGLLGMDEQAGVTSAYFPERAELGVAGTWEPLPERDWNAEARRRLTAVRVGGLVVTPPWLPQTPPDAVAVVVDPAQAFGTGHHETTTACLAALQEVELAGRTVLDVGTGSGVLAIAAALLGAGPVLAVDNDPLAVEAARHNAARNSVAIEARLATPDEVDGVYDVVLANLDTATIGAVAGDLAARLAPGGCLIASGVSVERLDDGVAALEAAGLVVWARPGAEWVLLSARHAS
ncbi:MAG TPA: 50S ribosomal protein L11 methyltransferase [Egibacteraceae bacterium]|nr:50S ribosomal protein L11 methyltransferase [Egibacteraceae bacterium]